jgi:hypothetical protein
MLLPQPTTKLVQAWAPLSDRLQHFRSSVTTSGTTDNFTTTVLHGK